jgi:hypothetical protein
MGQPQGQYRFKKGSHIALLKTIRLEKIQGAGVEPALREL